MAANCRRLVQEQANYMPHEALSFLIQPAELETMSVQIMNALVHLLSYRNYIVETLNNLLP